MCRSKQERGGSNIKTIADALVGVIENAKAAIPPKESDYLDPEDGLKHCGICGEAIEAKWVFLDLPSTRPRKCLCQRKGSEQREMEREAHTVSLYREDCFPDPSLAEVRLERDDNSDSEIGKMVRNYVDNFDHFYETGRGLVLTGPVGTGKTFYAACIANALVDKKRQVKMTSISRCVSEIMAGTLSENEYIDYLQKYALVIFDDLGVERNTPFMNDKLYNIINSRYNSKKPMLITTNIPLSQLGSQDGIPLDRARVFDRILKACVPIEFNGDNIRRQKAREEYSRDMKILRGERK